GRGVRATLDGDASLRRRPMTRIATPLTAMGAIVRTHEGCPPIEIGAREGLGGIEYRLPVASAQVKSAVLLAGLAADAPTRVVDPFGSRDHTERMLPRFGARIDVDGNVISLEPGALTATHIAIPGDPSSAAFLVAAALLVPGSRVNLPNIGTNPTRTG